MQAVLLGGRDAGLVLPVELDGLIRARELPGRQAPPPPNAIPAPKAPAIVRALRR